VALEAAYGWEWLADLLEETGYDVHLAHPLRTQTIAAARVKTDAVDAKTLAHRCAPGSCRCATRRAGSPGLHRRTAQRPGPRWRGRGQHVGPDRSDRVPSRRESAHLVAGAHSFNEVSTLLGLANLFPVEPIRDSACFYRRWAFESAALDLALRQSGLSLQDAVCRPARPVNLWHPFGSATFRASTRARAARRRSGAPLHSGPDAHLGRRSGCRTRAPGSRGRRRHEGLLPQRQRGHARGRRPVSPRDRGPA